MVRAAHAHQRPADHAGQVRTDLLGRRRARSRFTGLWEFSLFIVVLLLVFLGVVDMAVTRGDDRLLRLSASETATAVVATSEDLPAELGADEASADIAAAEDADDLGADAACEPVGLRVDGRDEGDALPVDAVCLAKSGVRSTRSDARVRIEWGRAELTVCVMMEARSVTGLLGPFQRGRTLRTVVVQPVDDGGAARRWAAAERPLDGSDWGFCPAGRGGGADS
jgi:hypothetical protein